MAIRPLQSVDDADAIAAIWESVPELLQIDDLIGPCRTSNAISAILARCPKFPSKFAPISVNLCTLGVSVVILAISLGSKACPLTALPAFAILLLPFPRPTQEGRVSESSSGTEGRCALERGVPSLQTTATADTYALIFYCIKGTQV